MAPGTASRRCWSLLALVTSLALSLCESFAVQPASARSSTAARFESAHVHVHAGTSRAAGQPHVLGSAKRLEAPRARAWALASRCGRMCGRSRELNISTFWCVVRVQQAAVYVYVRTTDSSSTSCCCCSPRSHVGKTSNDTAD